MVRLLLAFVFIVSLGHTVHAGEKVFDAKSYTLDNGLQVIVIENNRAPVITHMLWYKVGAADEPPGKSGIAHFLEHLMFKGHSYEGLGSYTPGETSKIVRSLGGEDNAFTSQDYTAYYQSIASEHLETVMRMEAGRMRGLAPPLEEVASENKVILEERSQRTDNDPRAQMAEQLNEALYPNHPYALPVIGWRHEMEHLNWDDAKAFYDRFYVPNNAVLIVAGAVTGERVLALAQNIYGRIPKGKTVERVRTISPPFIARSRVTLEHETIQEPVLRIKYRAPSYRQSKQESLALQVLETIMGAGSTSRLYKTLVVEKKIATNIGFSYNSTAWDDGNISIAATPASPDQLDIVEAEIYAQLKLLIKDGITADELSEAKIKLQNQAIFARDSLSGPALIIGYTLVTGSSLDDIETWPAQIETVTAEQVQAAATRLLNPDMPDVYPPVVGVLLPEKDK